jgi:hypothetical protein
MVLLFWRVVTGEGMIVKLRSELLPPAVVAERLAELRMDIERIAALIARGDRAVAAEAVDAFNASTGHSYADADFATYEGWRSLDEFALEAARPAWPRVPDISAEEVAEIVRRIQRADSDTDYFVRLFDANTHSGTRRGGPDFPPTLAPCKRQRRGDCRRSLGRCIVRRSTRIGGSGPSTSASRATCSWPWSRGDSPGTRSAIGTVAGVASGTVEDATAGTAAACRTPSRRSGTGATDATDPTGTGPAGPIDPIDPIGTMGMTGMTGRAGLTDGTDVTDGTDRAGSLRLGAIMRDAPSREGCTVTSAAPRPQRRSRPQRGRIVES